MEQISFFIGTPGENYAVPAPSVYYRRIEKSMQMTTREDLTFVVALVS